ncbi:spermatogenesis-assoc protein 6 [Desmophyllum pertusum]|uniref:Spermatogenesis-assoc protein 6 n=1 Tax=Desmophyllum pertusum TaxID=174260 RepID=A0A9X0D0H0_9CNID|nr:spermatogenesis-assoc protein 6 [Desmophyllum pertusum]
MPRKAMKVVVELDIHTVSCPGTFLRDYGYVYLKVNCMGLEVNTKSVAPTFHCSSTNDCGSNGIYILFLFKGFSKAVKIRRNVTVHLKVKTYWSKLRQHDDYISDGYVIGHYANMQGTICTQLITGQPLRLEFSTKTTIKEVPDPMDYISSPRRSRSKSPTRRPRSSSPSKLGMSSVQPLPAWKYSEDFPSSSSTRRKAHTRSATAPSMSLSQSYRPASPSRSLSYALDDLDVSQSSWKNFSDPVLRFKSRYSPNLRAALGASDRIQQRVERVIDGKAPESFLKTQMMKV